MEMVLPSLRGTSSATHPPDPGVFALPTSFLEFWTLFSLGYDNGSLKTLHFAEGSVRRFAATSDPDRLSIPLGARPH